MKLIFTFALILTSGVTAARANDCYAPQRATIRNVDYCAPYVVCTQRISSCREQRMGYDTCGRQVCRWVTVVTFRDVYNNGATRTYTRTFGA